jgi:ParB-like chromosome segregation protein Spo0J
MAEPIRTAFDCQGVHIAVERILPMKKVNTDIRQNSAYRRILSSIREIRLIEPIFVFPQGTGKNPSYAILDGHMRFEALKALGHTAIPCLIATEDEAYTYNHKVNAVPPIQEHFMILKAIESGVSEERIAAALDLEVNTIRIKRDLLNGICPEAIEILKNKVAARQCLAQLRRVKPLRQIEMAELMVASSNFTSSYAKCLLAASTEDQLVEPGKPKTPKGLKVEDIVAMERERDALDQNFLALEESHGKTVLNLVLVTGWLRKVLENNAIAKFMASKHREIYAELEKLIESASLQRET